MQMGKAVVLEDSSLALSRVEVQLNHPEKILTNKHLGTLLEQRNKTVIFMVGAMK